jgi:type IV secretory pathway VirB10-like protein
MAWFGPGDDHTYYRQAVETGKSERTSSDETESPGIMSGLFSSGEKKLAQQKREDAEKNRRKVAIRYSAPQVVDVIQKGPKAIRMGSKLLGFLMSAIDTREPSLVRVLLPRGGAASGVEIEKGSILFGQFSHNGSSDKVQISFFRLDTPDGNSKKISAVAVDAGDYTVGLRGETFTGGGVKLAAGMGLTMFSGMSDVLTEKESLGFSANGVQAKSTMKNALLQGLSRAAQDQAGRTEGEIASMKDYVVIPEGKEMIIQLTEDYRRE